MTSNRRRFTRTPLELDAVLIADAHRYLCRLRDFCSGGLLLECNSPPPAWPAGRKLQLEVFLDQLNEGLLHFDFEIRHVQGALVGGAFVKAPFQQVLKLSRTSQAQSFRGSPRSLKGKSASQAASFASHPLQVNPLWKAFVERIQSELRRSLILAFSEGSDALERALPEQPEGPKRRSYVRILRLLRQSYEDLAAATAKRVIAALQQFRPDNPQSLDIESPALEKLSLVDRQEFESWLLANVATRSIETELGSTLDRLNRFTTQVTDQPLLPDSNPAHPKHVIRQLHNLLEERQLSYADISTIYRYWGPTIQDELKALYENVLWDLIEPLNGDGEAAPLVIKKSTTSVSAKPITATRPKSTDPLIEDSTSSPTGRVQAPPTPSPNSDATDTFQTLRGLFELQHGLGHERQRVPANWQVLEGGRSSSPRRPESGVAVTSDSLDIALDRLMQASLHEEDHGLALGDEIRQTLQEAVTNGAPPTLPEAESEIIELTERLFLAIDDNPSVGQLLRRWMMRLKYAILKVALKDFTFFSNQEHPARQVVNQLGRLSAGRVSVNQLEQSLEHFVTRILGNAGNSNELFGDVLGELQELVERQEKAFKRSSERIAKAADARQRLAKARQRICDDMQQRLAGREVPKLVLQLLYDAGWRQHLLVSLLKQEEKYREVLGLLDMLLRYPARPNMGLAETQRGDGKLLLSMVRGELAKTGHSSLVTQLVQRLTHWLLEGRDQDTVLVDEARLQAWESPYLPEPGVLEAAQTASPSSALRRGRLAQMKTGDWLMLREPGREPRYLCLAWADERGYRFTYMDQQGLQDCEYSVQDLVDRINRGQARILDKQDLSLVEQGLNQVVHSVYEAVANQASADPLTGLPNRHDLERQLSRVLARSTLEGSRHVLCFMDVDRFRVINNTLGIQAGDRVLKDLARLLKEQIPENALIGRLGGNEFGILFPNCPRKLGTEICDQLRETIEKYEFSCGDKPIKITVSMGVAAISEQVENLNESIKRASLACMAAKEQGGNRVRIYQSTSRDQARQQEMMEWLARLEQPLERLVQLRCQPIVPIQAKARRGAHYEVLLGVRGPDNSLLSPVALIEAAEKFNRMTRVDRWVIANVYDWMKQNSDQLEHLDGFSINLSGTSMNDEQFLRDLIQILERNRTINRKICFEITETSAVTNLDRVVDFIRDVKRFGCQFSLDDFGTGMSSYAYLRELPVDYVKIDGVFIRGLMESVKDQALVKSISELASFMGMETIAEYVENEQVLDLLGRLGVDHAQGYFVGKPVLMSELRLQPVPVSDDPSG